MYFLIRCKGIALQQIIGIHILWQTVQIFLFTGFYRHSNVSNSSKRGFKGVLNDVRMVIEDKRSPLAPVFTKRGKG